MPVHINFIQRKPLRERVWKTLSVVVGVTTILNVSLVGTLLVPLPASAHTTPPKTCSLTLTKTVDQATAAPGDILTYSLSFANTGTADCTGGGVRLDDLIPAGTTYVDGSATPSTLDAPSDIGHANDVRFGYISSSGYGLSPYTPNPTGYMTLQPGQRLLSWNAHTIIPGQSGTVTFQVTVNDTTLCGSTDVTNSAKIFSDQITAGVTSNLVTTHVTATCNGTIELKKIWSGTPGQTTLNIGSTPQASDVATQLTGSAGAAPLTTGSTSVASGTYYVSEMGNVSNYQASLACMDNGQPVTPGIDNAVSVTPEHQVVCTFTNTYISPKGSISGHKYNSDTDHPLSNWEICLSPSGHGSDVVSTDSPSANDTHQTCTTTNEFGFYQFTNLDFGTYTVTETQQPGWHAVSPASGTYSHLTVGAEQPNLTNQDFINAQSTGTITVHKFQDDGQTPLAGATFKLCPHGTSHNCVIITDGVAPDTNADGLVTFTNLPAGTSATTYDITETVSPVGWTRSTQTRTVTISCDHTNVSTSFTDQRDTGTINVIKRVDTDGDGRFETTNPSIGSWSIDGHGTFAFGSVQSAATGSHTIAETYPGPFHLVNWFYGTDGSCTNEQPQTLPASVTVAARLQTTITICNARNTGAVAGVKFNDHNGNGVMDAGEPGVSGVMISLSSGDTVLATTTTNTTGYYSFTDIVTGTYTVAETIPSGWVATTPNSVANVVVDNVTTTTVNFGNFKTFSISGLKFNDLNGNGVQDTNELGLSGWTITLDQGADGTVDQFIVTDANGVYQFTNLGPGTYRLRETPQVGWAQMTANPSDVTGVSGTDLTGVNFGNRLVAARLGITKTNDVIGYTNPGKQVTYTITVTNTSTATDIAKNVTIIDTLPAGFTFTDTGLATKTTAVGDLGIGMTKSFTYLVSIASAQTAGTYTNTASATSDNATTVTASSNVEVRVPSILGAMISPELTLTKTVTPTTVNAGGTATYTVTITNPGDSDVTNVVLTDTLPKGFTFLDTGLATRTWNIGTLKAQYQRVIDYTVNIATTVTAGHYTNKAVVVSTELDPRIAQATVTVLVPRVLGLATTGASTRDYLFFLFGALLIMTGVYATSRLGRRSAHGFNQ